MVAAAGVVAVWLQLQWPEVTSVVRDAHPVPSYGVSASLLLHLLNRAAVGAQRLQ